jgi:hypothetical protein
MNPVPPPLLQCTIEKANNDCTGENLKLKNFTAKMSEKKKVVHRKGEPCEWKEETLEELGKCILKNCYENR